MSELTVEIDREEDGRRIGEVPDLPGVLAYGSTRDEAVAKRRRSPFVFSQIASNAAKTFPRSKAFSLCMKASSCRR